jgi:hypothetical protein
VTEALPWQSNRALAPLTEEQCRRVISDSEAEVVEWAIGNVTFVCSRRYLSIVRTGAMGGDMMQVDGGFVYPHDLAYLFEKREIDQVGTNVRMPR